MEQNQQQADEQRLSIYNILADAPIDRDNDHLKFQPVTHALATFILEAFRHVERVDIEEQKQGYGLTIGIYGDWGSGKTSFLKMVEADLEAKGISPIWFEAWKYDKQDNLWAALLQTILNTVSKQSTPGKRMRVRFKLWRKSLNFRQGTQEVIKKLLAFMLNLIIFILILFLLLSLASFFTGSSLTQLLRGGSALPGYVPPVTIIIAAAVSVFLSDPFNLYSLIRGELNIDFSRFENKAEFVDHIAFVDKFTAEFMQIINDLDPDPNRPLVVIVDDLDRCLPEKALQVLEATKAFLDYKKCVFLLALDRIMVERYVLFKYQGMIGLDVEKFDMPKDFLFHKDYMDKIIKMSVAVPRLLQDNVRAFVENLLPPSRHRTPQAPDAAQDIKSCLTIFSLLPPNPRKIKRTLRAFLFVRDLLLSQHTLLDELIAESATLPMLETLVQAEVIRRGAANGQEQVKKEVITRSFLLILAKLIVIQYRYPYLYEMLIEEPECLEKLEKYYTGQSEAFDLNVLLLAEVRKGPDLAQIFQMELDKGATFTNPSVIKLITLVGSVALVVPTTTAAQNVVESILPTPTPIWQVSNHRNPLFTGREQLLRQLYENFTNRKICMQAISGLGGVGKTQLALEYAYRHRDEYTAVFWFNVAGDSDLSASFGHMASWLDIPQQQKQSQELIIASVKQWLKEHSNWLLVLDNVEDLNKVSQNLLSTGDRGHILLTTSAQAVGGAILGIEVVEMNKEEGTVLLLQRAGLLKPGTPLHQLPEETRTEAEKIVEMLGGLPLALDQAGAFIDETKCTLSDYIQRYQTNSMELLKRRGDFPVGHRDPVATTWKLSFENVEKDQAAADLLRFCAFLYPDDIPEALITIGTCFPDSKLQPFTTDLLKLDEAIGKLRSYSLLRRDPDNKTISIHRLVQEVIRSEMDERTQKLWAEQVVKAVNCVFPAEVNQATWETCASYLPQAQVCAALIEQYNLIFPQAADLLHRTGGYLFRPPQLAESKACFQATLLIRGKLLIKKLLAIASAREIEFLSPGWRNTLHEAEQKLLNLKLSALSHSYTSEIEQLLHDLLDTTLTLSDKAQTMLWEEAKDELLDLAVSLVDLAGIYQEQGQYEQAHSLYDQALNIRLSILGHKDSDLDTASIYNNMASIYRKDNDYALAEHYYEAALKIFKQVLGTGHVTVANTQNNLARLYQDEGKYRKAEQAYKQALTIAEKVPEQEYSTKAIILNNLADLYKVQKKYADAEAAYKEAQRLYENYRNASRLEHPDMPVLLNNLAGLYRDWGKDEEAENYYQKALESSKRVWGKDHPAQIEILKSYAALKRKMGQAAEASQLDQQVASLKQQEEN
ncbi:MAG TPA: tetratricopeptide repeat protein [Ktedonobacteraceae bacterium]|nr:tetratricopeptide repeat protein [Ktedonobacteraceae bacterium]